MTMLIVVDLGFGDAGKGTIVDFLVREHRAQTVVRFNGGAQAGHNVVTNDGRHHTFAQFGAGTFAGAHTHLADSVLIHPTALLQEAQHLASVGIPNALHRLTIDYRALVITPYQQAAGRLRELARGTAAHGTCGVGIGETMKDSFEAPDLAVRVQDLKRPAALIRKLQQQADYKRTQLQEVFSAAQPSESAQAEWRMLTALGIAHQWLNALTPLLTLPQLIVDETALGHRLRAGPTVFEGAQGVLLDEQVGFHPHVTWSRCTPHHARRLLVEHGIEDDVTTFGVLRSYGTRHGAGPFPTECDALCHLPEPHNADQGWQGNFRRGWFDAVLSRYALAASPVDALALTHLDRPETRRLCAAYRSSKPVFDPAVLTDPRDTTRILSLVPPEGEQLDRQRVLGQRLADFDQEVSPPVTYAASFIREVEHALQVPVTLTSWGPTASNKRWRATPYQTSDAFRATCFSNPPSTSAGRAPSLPR